MIHFLEQHFVELVTITSIIYLTLATILVLYQTPDTAVYKTFRRSKRLMAGGMMLISRIKKDKKQKKLSLNGEKAFLLLQSAYPSGIL